jgi:ring-1,2-phenylacetyl-CoA epoxidase subunit PaaC
LLEEDIAFSSMAQDKVGQSQAIYSILHQLGEQQPDTIAFMRNADQFHNCILVELPNAEYDFSLIRHFLYDTAESIRFEMLMQSSFQPLADLARKIRGELRYHTLHANTWIKQLGTATTESISRLQSSLEHALPFAFGIFEPSPFENELVSSGVFAGEEVLKEKWIQKVTEVIEKTDLKLPDLSAVKPVLGGRRGKHSEHLQPLLDEMSEVFKIDPNAEW